MQEDENISLSVTPKVGVLDLQCSCLDCNSSCFIKRYAVDNNCSCTNCRNSDYCFLRSISKNILAPDDSGNDNNPSFDVNKKEENQFIEKEQFSEEENKEFSLENTIKRSTAVIISKTDLNRILNTKEVFSADKLNHKHNHSDEMYVDNEMVRSLLTYDLDNEGKGREEKISGILFESKGDKLIQKQSLSTDNANMLLKDILSTSIQDPKITKYPFENFQNCMLPPKVGISTAKLPLSYVDIYKKIQDAYNACSCKVCECVTGKALKNETCRCKPCQCDDCTNLKQCTIRHFGNDFIQKHDEKCCCMMCDKKSCKVESQAHRSFLNKEITESCDCDPCQCVECSPKSIHRTLIVAPVGEELHHHYGCRCDPCECYECSHRYGVTVNGQREISTSINRHPQCHCELCDNEACIPDNNQSCRCVRQSKVMSKPNEKDSHDYDIRTAQITYDNKLFCSNVETVAMFAALPSSYTQRVIRNQCQCDPCECLNCDYKCCSKAQKPLQNHGTSEISRKVSIAGVCSCHKRDKYDDEGLHYTKLDKVSDGNMCNCYSCNCVDDIKNNSTCVGDICNNSMPSRKNHSIHSKAEYDTKRQKYSLYRPIQKSTLNDPLIQTCIATLDENKKVFQQDDLISRSKSSEFIENFRDANHLTCVQECYGNHRMFCNNMEDESNLTGQNSYCVIKSNLSKHDQPEVQSSTSLFSSTLFVNGSDVPPTCRVKSQESSSNSSGHDCANDLAYFHKLANENSSANVQHCDARNSVMFNNEVLNDNLVLKNSLSNLYRRSKDFQSQTQTIFTSENMQSNGGFSNNIENQTQTLVSSRKLSNISVTKKANLLENDYANLIISSNVDSNRSKIKVAFDNEFKRVQKTLQEAREYSHHLVCLFEKYAMANKEFESVSELLKHSDSLSHKIHILKHVNKSIDPSEINTMHEPPTKDSDGTFNSTFDEIYLLNNEINKQNIYFPYNEFKRNQSLSLTTDVGKQNDQINLRSSFKTRSLTETANSLQSQAIDMTSSIDLNQNIDKNYESDNTFMDTTSTILNTISEEKEEFNQKQRRPILKLNKRHSPTKRSKYAVKRHKRFQNKTYTESEGPLCTTDSMTNPESCKIFQEVQDLQKLKTIKDTEGQRIHKDFCDENGLSNDLNMPSKSNRVFFIEKINSNGYIINLKENNHTQSLPKVEESINLLNCTNNDDTNQVLKSVEKVTHNLDGKNLLNSLEYQNTKDMFKFPDGNKQTFESLNLLSSTRNNTTTESTNVFTSAGSMNPAERNKDCLRNDDSIESMKTYENIEDKSINLRSQLKLDHSSSTFQYAANMNKKSDIIDVLSSTKNDRASSILDSFTKLKDKSESANFLNSKLNDQNHTTKMVKSKSAPKNQGKDFASQTLINVFKSCLTEQSEAEMNNEPLKKNICEEKIKKKLLSLHLCKKTSELPSREVPKTLLQERSDFRTTNFASEKVQMEVKRLLELPFLQILKRQKTLTNNEKNCEALKVTSLVTRRISDHSVLVKWAIPDVLDKVEGYEVLIDGLLVKKMLSPSRRMAVLSCLPNNDKILVTIRTVVTAPVLEHYPQTTLVYNTRKEFDTETPKSRLPFSPRRANQFSLVGATFL